MFTPLRAWPYRSLWPWLVAAALAVALIAVIVVTVTASDHGRKTGTVPALVGLPDESAASRVKAAGFVSRVERVPTATTPAGLVLRQTPEPGAELSTGSKVGFVVSLGRPDIVVPNVTGLQRTAAIRLLAALRLQPLPRTVPSRKAAGVVLSQTPAAGTKLARGAQVFVEVSKGPPLVLVPRVRGAHEKKAVAFVKKAGLIPVVRHVVSAGRAGIVLVEDPPPASQVPEGSRVLLEISRPSKKPRAGRLVTVPALQGLTIPQAIAAVRTAGLVPVIVPGPSTAPRGRVVGQAPQPKSRVQKGSNVRIEISTGQTGTTETTGTTTVPTTTGARPKP